MKNKGFTLAEVLITLSILGVIAAITVPSIIRHFKKLEIETRFKKAYSLLVNAVDIAAAENGGHDKLVSEGVSNGDVYFSEHFLKPYLNYNLFCTSSTTPSNECGKILKGKNGARTVPFMSGELHGSGTTNISDHNAKFILKNGMYLIAFIYSNHIRFAVDINGNKGPNQFGYDIFYFSLFKRFTGNHCATYGLSSVWCNKGRILYPGVNTYECYLHGGSSSCGVANDCNIDGQGTTCAIQIVENGFKLPDNYPIK